MSNKIVEVVISRQTTPLNEKSFSIAEIFSSDESIDSTFLTSTSRNYTDLISVAADFATNTETYKAAQALMSQENKPSEFRIFRREAAVQQVKTVAFNIPIVAGQVIKAVVNGTALTDTPFQTDSAITLGNLRGKIAAVEGVSSAVLTVNSIAVTAVLEWDLSLSSFSIVNPASTTVTITNTTAGHTIADDLAVASAENKDWYLMLPTTANKGAILAAAKSIEGMVKMAIFMTADSDCKTSVNTDIMSKLKANAYSRSIIMYTHDTSEHINSAWAGRVLPLKPGKVVFGLKTLAGVTVDPNLLSTAINNIAAKNGNFYTEELGKNLTKHGKVAGGDFADVIRDLDYVQAQLILAIFMLITYQDKFDYTDENILVVDQVMKSVFEKAFENGIIQDDYITKPPRAVDVPVNTRANRLLPDLPFTLKLKGSIQAASLAGIVKI